MRGAKTDKVLVRPIPSRARRRPVPDMPLSDVKPVPSAVAGVCAVQLSTVAMQSLTSRSP